MMSENNPHTYVIILKRNSIRTRVIIVGNLNAMGNEKKIKIKAYIK
jgi:hypothetical protein